MPAPYSTIYEIELFCFDMVKNNPRKKLRTTYTLVDKQCLEFVMGSANINALEDQLSATFYILTYLYSLSMC